MILENSPYLVAFLVTAGIHMAWSSIPFLIHQQFLLLASASMSVGSCILKLHLFALILVVSSMSFLTASAMFVTTPQTNQAYNFDDLKTTNGLGEINSYNLLTFAGFSVIAPQNPGLPYILPSDRNCATSLPNALLGSRYGPRQRQPTITVNKTATQDGSVYAHFDLHSLSIKPLAMPIDPMPINANLTIRGWPANSHGRDDGSLVFFVEWTTAYREPLFVDFDSKQFTKERWQGLGWLELSVDYGPDQLDWEFCLDDLVVGFTQCEQKSCLHAEGQIELVQGESEIEQEYL